MGVRTSFISLVFDLVRKKFDFVLMVEFLYPGTIILSNFEHDLIDLRLGFRTWLKYIRSAGTKGQIIQKNRLELKVRLPSGFILTVSNLAVATLGNNSNVQNKQIILGKAGRLRLLGKRPSVRGIAMN